MAHSDNPVLNQLREGPGLNGPSQPSEAIQKLRAMLNGDPSGWDTAWQQGVTPWDGTEVQPALREAVEEDGDKWGMPKQGEGRALVAGCGRGYDPVYFARRMRSAWGIDISEKAVEVAREFTAAQPDPPSNVEFHALDFFTFEVPEGGFDLCYDFTFYCALPPSQRRPLARRYAQLLAPNGRLLMLKYPIDGDRPGGPPFSVDPEEVDELMKEAGLEKIYSKVPSTGRHPRREILTAFKKP